MRVDMHLLAFVLGRRGFMLTLTGAGIRSMDWHEDQIRNGIEFDQRVGT